MGGIFLAVFPLPVSAVIKIRTNQGILDYWIVKTDANGIKQWDKTFGGSGRDDLHSLQQTTDGGYILGGFSVSGISGDKS